MDKHGGGHGLWNQRIRFSDDCVCTLIYDYIYIYIYIYVCVCVCVCIYIYTHTHTHIYIYVCVCLYVSSPYLHVFDDDRVIRYREQMMF